jgi:hypothetical protein
VLLDLGAFIWSFGDHMAKRILFGEPFQPNFGEPG